MLPKPKFNRLTDTEQLALTLHQVLLSQHKFLSEIYIFNTRKINTLQSILSVFTHNEYEQIQ